MKEMTTREIQLICLDILKDIHEFCIKNDIRYSLSGGSLLGAIRHNGFIPWDDDVDIQMTRPYFDKFIHTYVSNKGFKVFSPEIQGAKLVKSRIARVCDMEKTYVDQGPERFMKYPVGVWVDVIPVDGAPSEISEAKKYVKHLRRMEQINSSKVVSQSNLKEFHKYQTKIQKFRYLLKWIFGKFVSNEYVYKVIRYTRNYSYKDSNFFVATSHYGIREWQPKIIMKDYVLHKFEDADFYIMDGYKDNLTALYGDDYMALPPEKDRKTHSFYKRYWK